MAWVSFGIGVGASSSTIDQPEAAETVKEERVSSRAQPASVLTPPEFLLQLKRKEERPRIHLSPFHIPHPSQSTFKQKLFGWVLWLFGWVFSDKQHDQLYAC
ncbi:hypothetical protein EJ02DRAFT_68411 [Clathrospora elynae]|uniref:Uncharacterized protein n=1 Tax=Clathrospora elynae TaxID=706981 RepID=A0A6A5SEU4_9PLEO|nr:hypothetical protein EJ02DRAFT_68411 [Clathrospora elynae]